MYSRKKKIAAFALVLLLTIPLLFTTLLLVQQKALQISSRVKFDTEIILTISVSKKDINWVKKGKEVLINGVYFDVKNYKVDGDYFLLTGYYDHKEDKLVNRIKKTFTQKNDSESPMNQMVIKFLFFSIYTNQNEITIANYGQLNSHTNNFLTEKIPEAPTDSFSPPPES